MRKLSGMMYGLVAAITMISGAAGANAQSPPATGTFGAPASPTMQNGGPGGSTQPGTVPSTMQTTPGVLPPDPTRQGIRAPYQQPSMGGFSSDPRSSSRNGRR